MVSDKIWSFRTNQFLLEYNAKRKTFFPPKDVERTVGSWSLCATTTINRIFDHRPLLCIQTTGDLQLHCTGK